MPGLRIMRSRRIDGFTSIVRAQPVLSIERTIVDLAGIIDMTSFRRLLTNVVARELVTADGSRYHSSVSARSYDRQRDRALARRGWHIERFTTDDVRRRPRETQRQASNIRASRAELFKRAG